MAKHPGLGEHPGRMPLDERSGRVSPDRLRAAATAAAVFYTANLRGSRAAARYLRAHGIGAARSADPWRVGYAPSRWTALADHLRGAGFTAEEIVAAGLCFPHRASGHLLDRFRDRLVFPVTDRDNQVIAFTARDLSGRADAVWINSPETPLYRKSQILYGLGQQLAHPPRGTGDPVVFLVEGAADVLAVRRMVGTRDTTGAQDTGGAGHRSAGGRRSRPPVPPVYAVAPCGTHLSTGQLDLLRQALPGAHLVLAFDGDEPGRRATARAYPIATTWPGRLSGARLPAGVDPASLLAAAGPARALAALIGSVVPLAQVHLANTIAHLFDAGRITNPVAFAEDRIVAYRAIADLFLDAPHASRAMAETAASMLELPVTDITRGVIEAWEAHAAGTRSGHADPIQPGIRRRGAKVLQRPAPGRYTGPTRASPRRAPAAGRQTRQEEAAWPGGEATANGSRSP